MGILLSRFKKKKETTFQILEGLDTRIKKIEDFSRDTEQRQRTVVGQLLLYSVGLYVLAAIFFYFYYFPTTIRGQILCVTPLLIFPILVILLKRLVQWYYHRKINKNQELLSELKDEKRQMLENVKDNETYKVAKQILEKFAPDQLRKPMQIVAVPNKPTLHAGSMTPMKTLASIDTPGGDLRRRPIMPTPQLSQVRQLPPMPRPIIPVDRSFLDKVVEYLVGDGPSNRYALICKQCHSHNGMALKEEFEYLAFNCCFCHMFNPARKQRPLAPRLPTSNVREQLLQPPDVDSNSESNEESQSSDAEIIEANEEEKITEKPEPEDASSQETEADKKIN